MARRPLDAQPRNEFEENMARASVDSGDLAARWGREIRRINQIRSNPKQIHLDAIAGVRSLDFEEEVGSKAFGRIMKEAGISVEDLALRWSLGVRRIHQIKTAPQQLHFDAIRGLLAKNTNKNIGDTE